MELKTSFRKEKEARNRKILMRFNELMNLEGAQIDMVTRQVMKEYGIYSPSTIWKIRKNASLYENA